jgi:Fic family protein
MKKQGNVKIHLSFGFQKNLKAALQEHRHLLYVILLHELQISKVKQSVCTTVTSYNKCEGTRSTVSSILTCDPM